MELTIEQALQQGEAAYKRGKLEDAERLFCAILQSQPKHPDANHNLGLIAVSVNKTDVALPLFKTALEANPQKEQFWVSYIDALIKAKQFGSAKKVLEQGKKAGWTGEKADALDEQLTLITQAAEAALPEQKKSPTFSEKRKKLVGEKIKNKNKRGLKATSPSDAEIANLVQQYQNGQYGDAERLALSLTERFPKHQLGWKVLGALYAQSGRNSEAIKANQVSTALSPQDAEAHNNLGTALQDVSRLEEAKGSYRQAIALKPDFAAAHYNLGVTLKELRRLEEAEASYRRAISLQPDYAASHYNLGDTLQELGRLAEAEASYRQVTALKPDFAEAHYNMGITLQELDRFAEAEASFRQSIALKPDFGEAHSNLGVVLKELNRFEEAEASYRQALALNPDYAAAQNNLGTTLHVLGRLEEAERSFRKALALKPDFAEGHMNLGTTLKELGRFEEAETSYRQAIALKPDYADAYFNLTKVLYVMGKKNSALGSIEQANKFDSKSKNNWLLLNFMKSTQSPQGNEPVSDGSRSKMASEKLSSNPLILNREVEAELIANLYELRLRELNETADARYGNGKCSLDFTLFENTCSIIKKLSTDLTRIIKKDFKSNIYIVDSFFNILNEGGGTTRHKHLNEIDTDFNLGKHKYSLVYYLCIGDQNCSEPGFLKLYDPVEEILPTDGMITIIPASRDHSSVYGGKTDRVMIGVNFYSF